MNEQNESERPFPSSSRPNAKSFRDDREKQKSRPARERGEERSRERHVTPLPDGRVVKGPRPAQRRNAQFWTDISQETGDLIQPVSSHKGAEQDDDAEELLAALPDDNEITDADMTALVGEDGDDESVFEHANGEATPLDEEQSATSRETPRRRTRAASAVVRSKKEKSVRGSGPTKPSQRGFKWPTP
jgi:hypothetical protein